MLLKESEKIELKRSTSELKEALIAMSAILNRHGDGEIYNIDVQFRQLKTGFLVTFMRPGGVKGGAKGGVLKDLGKRYALTARQLDVLKLIYHNRTMSLKYLAQELNINTSAVQKHIEQLKKKGVIVRIGPRKGGYWEVNE